MREIDIALDRATTAEEVKDLIKAGADVNAKDDTGQPCLINLVKYGRLDAAKALIEAESNLDVSYSGKPLLFYAETPEMAKMLLEAGLDADVKDQWGRTFLMHTNNPEMVKVFAEAGADLDARDKNGNTALFYARTPEMVKALAESGANIDARNNEGDTALMRAIINRGGDEDTRKVKALLEVGADAYIEDNRGKTAKHYVSSPLFCRNEDIKALIEAATSKTDDYEERDGRKVYKRDDGTVYLVKDNLGTIAYREDGVTVAWKRARSGNMIYYRDDGVTPEKRVDCQENQLFYEKDGKTPDYLVDKDGNRADFGKSTYVSDDEAVQVISFNGRTVTCRRDHHLVEEDGDCGEGYCDRIQIAYANGDSVSAKNWMSDIAPGVKLVFDEDGSWVLCTGKGHRWLKLGKDGTDVLYVKNGETVEWTRDKEGNETRYSGYGHDVLWTKDKDGNEVNYRYSEGKKFVEWTKDKYGNEVHYQRDGEKVDYTKDEHGNEVHYQRDGEKVDYTKDGHGNEVHYLPDGKTVDYKLSADGVRTDRDGIKDNILAKKRRYYAKKLGLEKVKTSKLLRQAEAWGAKVISGER